MVFSCYRWGWHNGSLLIWQGTGEHNDSTHFITCPLPSGYLLHSHGKSPFLVGKPSISMGHLFHGYVSHKQRVFQKDSYPYGIFYRTSTKHISSLWQMWQGNSNAKPKATTELNECKPWFGELFSKRSLSQTVMRNFIRSISSWKSPHFFPASLLESYKPFVPLFIWY